MCLFMKDLCDRIRYSYNDINNGYLIYTQNDLHFHRLKLFNNLFSILT